MKKLVLNIIKIKKIGIIASALLLNQVLATSTEKNAMQTPVMDVDYSINLEAIAMGQYLDQKEGNNNTYLGEMLNLTSDIRLTQGLGVNFNLVSDKRCIGDRLTEVNAAYLYYIFDVLGEVHIGNDKPIDQYIKSIDGGIWGNRSIASYFNCPSDSFSRYTIVDDHSALRLLWVSPIVYGFKVGLSYMPNSSVCRGISGHYVKNLASLGVSYECGNDDFSYGISAIGYLGKAYESTSHNVKALSCEGVIGYKNFELSGRAVFDGSSMKQLSQNNRDTAYMVDLSYTIKDTKISVGHMVSHRTSPSFESARAYTMGIQHTIGKYNIFTQYKRLYSKNNNGHIVMLGVSRNFNWSTL